MKIYYKVRESTLLDLLSRAYKLEALEDGGVDNWSWYIDSCDDFLRTYCKNNGIDPKLVDEGAIGFYDVAESDLKNFEEI